MSIFSRCKTYIVGLVQKTSSFIIAQCKAFIDGLVQKTMRFLQASVLIVAGLVCTTPAHAGIPVIDVASLIQAILSVLDQITQIENQISQIEGQVEHYKSITSGRGLGNYLRSSAFENYLPKELASNYDSLKSGYSSLSGAAKTLRDNQMIYNCADKTGDAQKECQEFLARPYQQLADLKQALEASKNRYSQINGLMDRAASSGDQKDIAELQARIGGEQSQLLQEMSRTQMSESLFAAQDRADKARQEEKRMERLNRTGNVLGDVAL